MILIRAMHIILGELVNPSTNDYFYFVADAKGKVYYNKTASEHEKTVADLKSKDLWS